MARLRGQNTVKGIWARCIAVLLMASIAGCGTVPEASQNVTGLGTTEAPTFDSSVTPYRLPSGAKVALIEGQFERKLSIQRRDSQGADGPLIQNSVGGAIVGAGAGTLAGALYGISCGPLFIVCSPLFAATGAVVGGVAGAVKGAQNAERYAKNVDEEVAGKDENEERKNEEAGKELVALGKSAMETLSSPPLLLERIIQLTEPSKQPQSDSRLTELPKQPPQSDYIFEVAVSEPTQMYITKSWLALDAQGRLIRTSDKSVVAIYKTSVVTNSYTFDEWKRDNARLVTTELDAALEELAKQFVKEWIKPALPENAELYIPRDIESTPEQTRGVAKRTDERPAGIDSGAATGIPTPEFTKPSKDAAAAPSGVAKGTNEGSLEKPIGKDIEQAPTSSDSPFPPATNPEHEWMRSTPPR